MNRPFVGNSPADRMKARQAKGLPVGAMPSEERRVRELVQEYWPELSRAWRSASEAVNHYIRSEQLIADLDFEVGAFERLRNSRTKPEEDRNTDTTNSVDKTYAAIAEIKRLGRTADSIEEIQAATVDMVEQVTGERSTWSERSILNHIRPQDFERLAPPELLAQSEMSLYRTERTPTQQAAVDAAHRRERSR